MPVAEGETVVSTPSLARAFTIIIAIVCAGLLVSIVLYRGPFLFWNYPLSDLGALRTETSRINVISRIVFDFTTVTAGLLMLRIVALVSGERCVGHRQVKGLLALGAAVGFFLLLMPYDVELGIHEAGGALVFGMLWGLTDIFSLELKRSLRGGRALVSQLVLQGTVLPYAFMFAARVPVEDAAQKFAVVGLMFSVWLSSRAY